MPMSTCKRAAALACLCLAVATLGASDARAANPFAAVGDAVGGVIEGGGRRLGKGLGEGAVEALQPALATTVATVSSAATKLVADVDVKVGRQVDHAGGVASRLLSETKGVVDDSLDKVDHILEKRLLQVQTTADGVVKKLDATVDHSLQTADRILKDRSAQLGSIVTGAIDQADQVIQQRIAQIDEDVALRLGNVDVIATKQRLGIEEMLVHVGVLLGILVFVVFVLRTLWRELARLSPLLADARGMKRTWGYVAGLGRPLLLQVAAALAAVLVIYALYDRLPLGARSQAAALATMHREQMEQSLARFDFSRVRFHASQLEILAPEQGAYYQAMAGKAELLRDLVVRPALLATDQGVAQMVERVHTLERQLGGLADPDVLTMKALILWQVGDAKRDEHAAASYCARALRLSPGGFALAPLARHYIQMFLHAPYLAPDTPYGRDSESLADLQVLGATPIENPGAFPLAPVIALDRAIARLDRELTPPYLDMLAAQADLVRELPPPPPARGRAHPAPVEPANVARARARRTAAAQQVLLAWQDFDKRIGSIPGLSGTSAVLSIFRLDDASYTRAAWFVEQAQSNQLAPLLADVADAALKVKLAPPRVAWEKRYGALIARELHTVAELQEADRFNAFEQQNRDFEAAYVAYMAGPSGPGENERRRAAALAAARLGVYVRGVERQVRQPLGQILSTYADAADAPFVHALASALETRGLRTL